MAVTVSAVTFALLGSVGGDALTEMRENPQVSEATITRLRAVYGLDQPLPVRYFRWLGGAVTGDLGDSIYYRMPVRALVWKRAHNTFLLGIAALAIAIMIAFTLGVAAARYTSKWLTVFIDSIILLTASTPRIVLALAALAISVRIGSAMLGTASPLLFWFAAMALSAPLISVFLAQFSTELDNAMHQDFVQLARAKGLSEIAIVLRHAIRAALNPTLALFGLSLGGVLSGSVIVESVLGREGLGTLMVTAVRSRDFPLVMGIVLLTSAAVWLGNTVAELLQAANDKRVRDAGI